MATRIQLRRDTAANWTSVDPVLAAGEPGFEEDTGKHKIGDGATAWSALPYFLDETARGQPNGYASLDANGLVPPSELPNIAPLISSVTRQHAADLTGVLPGGAAFADLTNDMDCQLAAAAGDLLLVIFSCRVGPAASSNGVYFEVEAVASGTAVDGGSATEWTSINSIYEDISGTQPYTVQAADVSSGQIVLRPRVASDSTTPDRTISYPRLTVVNLGPTRRDRAVILTPTLSTEETAVQEPSPYYDASTDTLWMFYSGGWASPSLHLASCPGDADPSDSANWTKHGRVLGQGVGGVAGPVVHSTVYVESGTVYVYAPDAVNGGNLQCYSCLLADLPAPTWTLHGTVLAPSGSATGLVNASVVKAGAGDYRMMVESSTATQWQTGYATGTSPTGPFTMNTFPVTGLQIGSGTFGGPWLDGAAGAWRLRYHASTTSNIPTSIYEATSTDLINWTRAPAPLIVRTNASEVDQVADYASATSTFGATAFWDGMDNPHSAGVILASTVSGRNLAS